MTKINEWEFFNPNPRNRETGDCVIRALSKATDRSWVFVYDELCNFGRDLGGLPNDDEVFEEFLEHNGFNIKSIPRPKRGQDSVTVQKFCRQHPIGTYVLSCAHHLTCVKDGKFYDLGCEFYNCKVYRYWEKV